MGQGARPPVSRKLPFLKSYRDRHGKPRHYLRVPGTQTVALPGEYGTREFMDAYWEARETAAPRVKQGKPAHPRSFAALVPLYFKSRNYTALKPITRQTYRNVIERFREAHGEKLVTGIRQRHVIAILDGLTGNRDTWRKCIRLLLNQALERGWIDVHPMASIRRPRKALHGFQAWTAADVAAYEAKWPTGSRERLALALLLYTGQRRSDVVQMGRQHVRDGKINVVQQKTGSRLAISLHSRLRAELDAAPKDQLTFLQTQYGKPYTADGFGNWFKEAVRGAGLPERCAAHGLRKTAAITLAEAGCTPSQIMAVTGHKNLAEVTLYTAAADQERLATQAIARTDRLPKPRRVRQERGNVQ